MKKIYYSKSLLFVCFLSVLMTIKPECASAQSVSIGSVWSEYAPIAKNIGPGSVDNVIAAFSVTAGFSTTITGVTLKTSGTYSASDISGFKLWHSQTYGGQPLDYATMIAQTGTVASGNNIVFSGALFSIPTSQTTLFYITADVSSSATMGNTINIADLPVANITFSAGTSTGSTLPAFAVQTIGTPKPIIRVNGSWSGSSNVSPGSKDVYVYDLTLEVSDADAVLTSLVVPTSGTYTTSDIANTGFKLWHRTYDGTVMVKSVPAVVSGGNLVFSGLTETIPKNTYNVLFITTDLTVDAVSDHTFGIESFPVGNIQFSEAQQIKGTTTLPTGPVHTIVVPSVEISSMGVSATAISPGSYNNVLYKLLVSPLHSSVQFSQLKLTTGGTYQATDIASGGFRIYFGDEDNYYPDEQLASINPVASGSSLTIDLSTVSLEEDYGRYIYVTADLATTAVAGRTINIKPIASSDLTIAAGTITGSGTAGGTFTIAATSVSFTDGGPASKTVSAGTFVQLHTSQITVSGAPLTFNGASFGVTGSYESSDFANENIYFIYHKNADAVTDLYNDESVLYLSKATSMPATGGTIAFNYLSEVDYFSSSIPVGTGYLSVVAKLSSNPVLGHTIKVSSSGIAFYTFRTGTKTGTAGNGGVQTIGAPSMVISAVATPAGNMAPGTETVIYKMQLDVSNASALLSSASFTASGTYDYFDVNGFALYLSKDLQYDQNDDYIAYGSFANPGDPINFSNIYNSAPLFPGTYYLFVIANTSSGAILGRTINITSTLASKITLVSGTVTGGTMAAGGTKTFGAPTSISLSFPVVSAGQIHAGTSDNLIYRFNVTPSGSSASLSTVNFKTSGTYELADLNQYEGFTLYYNDVNSMDGWHYVDYAAPVASGETLTFDGIGETIGEGATGYFFLVTNLTTTATVSHTIQIDAVSATDFTFTAGTATGAGSAGNAFEITEVVSGLLDQKAEARFSLFPNPSMQNEQVTIVTDNSNSKLLSIYNSTGSLIRSEETNTANIRFENLERGIYMITIRDLETNQNETKRLIVE